MSDRIQSSIRDPKIRNCISFFRELILTELDGIDCWVAGGAIRDYFFNDKTIRNDVDLYFTNETEHLKAVDFFRSKGLEPDIDNDRITNYQYKDHKMQLIKIYHDGPRETIVGFDFVCCMAAVSKVSFHSHDYFFDHNERKRLHFNHLNYPLKSLYRVQKYARYGYSMTRKQLIKLAEAIKLVNLTDENQTELNRYPQTEVESNTSVHSYTLNVSTSIEDDPFQVDDNDISDVVRFDYSSNNDSAIERLYQINSPRF